MVSRPVFGPPVQNPNVPTDIRRVYARDDVDYGFVVAVDEHMAPNDPASHSLVIDDREAMGLLATADGKVKARTATGNEPRTFALTEGEVFWIRAINVQPGTNLLGTTSAELYALFPSTARHQDDRNLPRTKLVSWETDSSSFDSTDFTVEWITQDITQDEIQLRRFQGSPASPTTVEYLTSATGGRGNTATWVDVASDLRELTLPYEWLLPGQTWFYQIKVRNSDDQETPLSPALSATGLPGAVRLTNPSRSGIATTGAFAWSWTVANIPQDEIQVRRGIPQPDGLTGIQYLNSVTGAWTNTERWLDVSDTLRVMNFNTGWHPASLGLRRYEMRVRDSSDVASEWSPHVDLTTIDP